MTSADQRYEFTTLDLDSTDDAARRRGFVESFEQAFHHASPEAAELERFQEFWREDGTRVKGAWLRGDLYGAGDRPVGTFTSFDGSFNTGAELVPAWLITDVTVSAAHRRRGLLSRLMRDDLASAAASDAVVAAMTVTEGGIYGRFGFNPAIWTTHAEVDVRRPLALVDEVERDVALVEPAEIADLVADNFAGYHAETRGSLTRPAFWNHLLRGDLRREGGPGRDNYVRAAVTLGADGSPDGHVIYRPESDAQGRRVRVLDLIGRSREAHLALWQFLGTIDLVDTVVASLAVQDPLRWAVADLRQVKVREVSDQLWLRVLDTSAALAARPWFGEEDVTLTVTDRLGIAEGTWTVRAKGGRAEVEPGGAGGVTLDVSALSALYAGGTTVDALAGAGRVLGEEIEVARFASIADGGPMPQAKTFF